MYSCSILLNILAHFTDFLENIFLVVFRKKHLYCTISVSSRTVFSKHLKNICIYIPVNFHKKNFVPQMCEALIGGRLNHFLKASRGLALVKYFKTFHFDCSFWKFNNLIPFTCARLCQFYSLTSPVLFIKNNKLWNERKVDFDYI